MSLFTSIISGAIGGLIATSVGAILVQWINRPILVLDKGVIKRGSSPYEERAETAEYNIQIQNTGRSVATNCKPRITLQGVHETTVTEPFMTEDGCDHEEVEVSKKITIDIIPEWNEQNSPNRIDINRDEHASFKLFQANRASLGPRSHNQIRFGSVLPEDEMAENDGIFSEPVRIETPSHRMSTEPSVNYKSAISRETFTEINWDKKEIVVTSANSKKLQAELEINWESGALPDTELK